LSGDATSKRRLTVMAVYGWPEFWSMGEGRGAPSFFLSVTSFPRNGHELHVLMPGPPGSALREDYHGVHLHRFISSVDFMPDVSRNKFIQHLRISFSYAYWFVRAVPAAMELAREVKPDAVVALGANAAPVARFVASRNHVPNVTRLFGTGLPEFLDRPLKWASRYRERLAFRTKASYIVLHDDGSGGDEVARRLGVDMDRFRFWQNGIDKAAFSGNVDREDVWGRLGVPPGGIVVLSVSRLHPEKHVERLVDAVPGVLADHPDTRFVIVGKGGEREFLEARAARLGVESHVYFVGSVDQEKLAEVYLAADVFVTLSDRTNASNPLYEAMMAGLAVVALNTGRTGDVVKNGDNGVLVEPGDVGRLGQLLSGLLSDGEFRDRLGREARKTADAKLPTIEERQAMEVSVVEAAVEEASGEVTERSS
jgi:glycogen(starch) synthase